MKGGIKMDQDLNVFKIPMPRWTLTTLRTNIRGLARRCKWAYQRATKGFCDYDRYDLEQFYTRLLIGSLKEFCAKGFEIDKEFHRKLCGIVNKLEFALKEPSEFKNPYEERIRYLRAHGKSYEKSLKKSMEWDMKLDKVRVKMRTKAFRKLEEVWDDLWD